MIFLSPSTWSAWLVVPSKRVNPKQTVKIKIQGFNLISLSGNKLRFSTNDEQDKKLFEMHENYIEKKSEEFFGKRLKFNWSTEEVKIKPAESKPSAEFKSSADPFEEVILNELGGEKIK